MHGAMPARRLVSTAVRHAPTMPADS
jgi:hypothetical protein